MTPLNRIHELLAFLYGDLSAATMEPQLHHVIARTQAALAGRPPSPPLSERDALLIAYGDSVHSPDATPLQTLGRFLAEDLAGAVSGVHILPFYPWTSDDGFSVVDYRAVDPELGEWEDVVALCQHNRVMLDAVINHVSRSSVWFQNYLRDEPPYSDYFITVDSNWDLSRVVRPRTLPLLTPVDTPGGERLVWTTFSEDQIDLNYANPRVLVEVADLLLFYCEQGADLIRLDAIAYLWKESRTRCVHLPQTHAVVQLLRAVLDAAAPHVQLITETNVPHADNISYFGKPLPADDTGRRRTDEAQWVYQFPLAPLILHTFATGNAAVLTNWAQQLGDMPGAFFNFTASHDGIGVLPALGILSPDEVEALVQQTLRHSGRISYRSLPDGSQTAYELNITFYDALNDPMAPNPDLDVARFLASQAIMLALAGLPGIYFQSLFGARNCDACLEATGRARSINREKFDLASLREQLATPGSHAQRVFTGYLQILRARASHPAFHPYGAQQIFTLDPAVFSLRRVPPAPGVQRPVICLTNVTGETRRVGIAPLELGQRIWRDLLNEEFRLAGGEASVELAPYQVLWLAEAD